MLPSQMLKARFCIVTPMFLGDADQKASSIRPPSLKGALRFWWRALNWSGFLKQANQNEVAALQAMHKEEARLFGATAADNAGGQGVFLLTVAKDETKVAEQPFGKDMSGAQLYLLGMGLGSFKDGNHTLRNALEAMGCFSVELLFRPKTSASDRKSVADALYAFGLLGALGSRARHGMGSVSLIGWEGKETRTVPKTQEEYKKAIQTLLGPETEQANTLPPFTAFSQKSEIWVSVKDKSPMRLLSIVGKQQMLYRSYGRNNRVLNQQAERNFADDHDLIMNATNGHRIQKAPRRVVFGLPHNYFFSSTLQKADVNYAPKGQDGRRSSPLILHIHKLADEQFLAVHALLPALFLPTDASIQITSEALWHPVDVPADVDWSVLTNYLKRPSFTQDKIYG